MGKENNANYGSKRLRSQDDLERYLKITNPRVWILLGACAAAVAGALVWGFFGSVSVRVQTYGVCPVIIWQSIYLNGKRKTWTCYAAKAGSSNYDENAPVCSAMYQKPAVLANGDMIPCAPLAGPYGNAGIRMDNVKEAGLQKAMTDGAFVDAITHTAGEKLRENKKCGSCKWAKNCQGGCPAMSFVFDGSLLGSDPTKCIFFNNGWYDKYTAVMDGWRNLNPL